MVARVVVGMDQHDGDAVGASDDDGLDTHDVELEQREGGQSPWRAGSPAALLVSHPRIPHPGLIYGGTIGPYVPVLEVEQGGQVPPEARARQEPDHRRPTSLGFSTSRRCARAWKGWMRSNV